MKRLSRFLERWAWRAVIFTCLLVAFTNVSRTWDVGVGPQPVEKGSTILVMNGESYDVTYKVFDDNQGRCYSVYFKDTPYEIFIIDGNRNGKMDDFLEGIIISDGDGNISINGGPGLSEGDPPNGRIYVGDVFSAKLTPETMSQLLREAESIIRQLAEAK